MPTGKVPITSDIRRKQWMTEGLLQSKARSFWSPMTGGSPDSVVYQSNNASAGEGHTVVFDYSGKLSGKAITGRERAYGKGEQKRKFSDKMTVERYRMVVNNGDKFDGVDIGDLSINEHADSRNKLADLFQRFKDQSLFDSSQGLLGQRPTHIIDLNTTFGYNNLLDIETTLRTSNGFSVGGIRAPIGAYTTADNRPCWLLVLDAAMAAMLKKDAQYQSLVYNADVRGNENRAIRGVFGKIGQLLLVEADNFFGDTESTSATAKPVTATSAHTAFRMGDSGVEIAGLRQKDNNGLWTGQEGYVRTGIQRSRGIILGSGALQMAFGKSPDYMLQESEDFKIDSESAVEFWMHTQKTLLKAENTDYKMAKEAGFDHGVISVDVTTST